MHSTHVIVVCMYVCVCRSSKLDELSSKFYTLIPHSFGRVRPPTIRTPNEIREKKDMLIVRTHIRILTHI